ncbi:MAG: phospho-N-acetylmuramoyl-pentapeptide-transferase [Firmicutes bacterium]|nr:phospho-N-acetylmuramoyl-pentapeptide-transferase [Bacillota bacterium]NLO65763.1 phospho-N-acetylmuramoyl-pentapeptide-transferase [Bacillota bacterium]
MAPSAAPFVSALVAFFVSLLIGPWLISYLHRLRAGQRVREDGPKTHLTKSGTPTMGGIMIVIALVVATVFFYPLTDNQIIMLFAIVGFAVVGFLDDYIKVVAKRSLGLRAREKLVAQFGLGLLIALYASARVGTDFLIPFSTNTLELPVWLYVPVTVFVLVGTVNAVNLTDGLDGLATTSVAVSMTAFGLIAFLLGYYDLTVVTGALVGGCLGFLWFNAPPARIIMGDTGSFGLGAALAAIAILTKTTLYLPIIGALYVIETLSVIIQVAYFRLTRGGRVFRMAPLHHHFEETGLAETTVMIRFVLTAVLFAAVGLLAFL